MRRLIQVAVLLLVLVHVGGPLFETVDQWDNFPATGNDFVLSFLAVVVCLGFMLLVQFWPRLRSVLSRVGSLLIPPEEPHGPFESSVWLPGPIPKTTPLPLRI